MARNAKQNREADRKTLNSKEWAAARERLANLSARVESFRRSKDLETHEGVEGAQPSERVR
jgi:hypothetical protein